MRRRMFLILALVIFVLAGVVYLVFSIGGSSQTPQTPTPATGTYNVVFVAQDIPAGSTITADSIIEGPWPKSLELPGLVTDKAAVIGRRARIDLRRGEPIFSSQIVESGAAVSDTASATALKIKTGKVAIAVPLSRLSGVAYAVGNGDHVMVIASFTIINVDTMFQTDVPNKMLLVSLDADGRLTFLETSGGRAFKESPLSDVLVASYYIPVELQRPRLVSTVLVQDARVLNVGNIGTTTVIPTPAAGAAQTTTAQIATTPDIMVIEVTPQEALAINFLIRMKADLTYALRSAGDTSVFTLNSVDLSALMEEFNITLPPNSTFASGVRTDAPYIPVLGNDVAVEVR
jgi:Flp pilus assembly protein CpaB